MCKFDPVVLMLEQDQEKLMYEAVQSAQHSIKNPLNQDSQLFHSSRSLRHFHRGDRILKQCPRYTSPLSTPHTLVMPLHILGHTSSICSQMVAAFHAFTVASPIPPDHATSLCPTTSLVSMGGKYWCIVTGVTGVSAVQILRARSWNQCQESRSDSNGPGAAVWLYLCSMPSPKRGQTSVWEQYS